MRILIVLLLALIAASISVSSQSQHPRLWVKQSDLARLRFNASANNPMYKALQASALEMKRLMDTNKLADSGSNGYEETFSEQVSALFAFMSLIAAEPERKDYATRARTVLMRAILEAQKGQQDGAKFRGEEFATSDRSRWAGAGWGLTVDWIYNTLSVADLSAIRQVFNRWSTEALSMQAYPCGQGEGACFPAGMDEATYDPKLLEGRGVRWAQNNYFAGHMRNAILMQLALDNPDKRLLEVALGRHLYAMQHTLNTTNRGGLGAEGLEYTPQTVGYMAQALLALETAGVQSPETVRFSGSGTFWADLLSATLHSSAPKSSTYEGDSVYQAAWYGDGQQNFLPDMIESFGALAARKQDAPLENGYRWALQNLAPGGKERLERRARGIDNRFHEAILYFLAFDPKAKIADPRPRLPLQFVAQGMGKVFSRTAWDSQATWFSSQCSWNTIDHMGADAGALELYKNGEWLTKRRVGYGFGWVASDSQNSASYESTMPDRDDYRRIFAERHSQWQLSGGDPSLTQQTLGGDVYTHCEMTARYNSERENVDGMKHASRSVVYLEPDGVVVFDRGRTETALGKRITYNLPASSVQILGNNALVTTAGKQTWKIQVLIGKPPTTNAAPIQDFDYPPDKTDAARGEAKYQQVVVNLGKTPVSRIVTVLNTSKTDAKLLRSSSPDWVGVQLGDTAVVLNNTEAPRAANFKLEGSGIKRLLVTGLQPNALYAISSDLSVRDGGTQKASSAGVVLANINR
jgi:hypothetical protein